MNSPLILPIDYYLDMEIHKDDRSYHNNNKKNLTYLNHFVHTSGNNGDGVIVSILSWNNSNLRNPVVVTQHSGQTLTLDGPDLDGLITRTGNDHRGLSVNGNGHDIGLVTNESLVSFTSGDIPQSQGFIPRGR